MIHYCPCIMVHVWAMPDTETKIAFYSKKAIFVSVSGARTNNADGLPTREHAT